VHQVEVPWARPGSGFTLLFEAWALLPAREMAVSEAAETLGIQDTRLWRMLTHYVDKAHAGTDWSKLVRVGVDESERSGDSLPQAARRASAARQTSRSEGHRYVTCFVDPDSGKLLYMTEGRDAATVESFAVELPDHQCSPEAIEEVAMDMSPAFQSGVAKQLPEASMVFDRYHVMALAGKATDEVRREVAREEGGLEKGAMWSLRGNKERLKAEQLEQRERLCRETGSGNQYQISARSRRSAVELLAQNERPPESVSKRPLRHGVCFCSCLAWKHTSRVDCGCALPFGYLCGHPSSIVCRSDSLVRGGALGGWRSGVFGPRMSRDFYECRTRM